MAEVVQLNAERSLPELEELKRVKLFTGDEIRKVVKKRKQLEYKVSSANKTKENYIKYIQYELELLNLIKLRRIKNGYDYKKKEIDGQIGNRINNLFKLVIKKFPDDVRLWISHREFLKKMKWHENMSGMMARMLKIHNKPELWVMVAKWELEDNKSCDTARQLLHRAIRFHPESEHIWQEYFRMELIYTEQLQKRRQALEKVKMPDIITDDVLKGKLALIAFQEASQAIKDVYFALSFMPICKEFDFTNLHQSTILDFIKENFPHKEETWNALARCCVNMTEKFHSNVLKEEEQKAIEYFEEGLALLPTVRMCTFYFQFLLDNLRNASSEKKAVKIVQTLKDLFERTFELRIISEIMFLEWIRILHSLGEIEKARQLCIKGSVVFPSCPEVWECCLKLHTLTNDDPKFFMILLRKAVLKVPDEDRIELWKLAIDNFSTTSRNDIIELFEFGLSQGPVTCKFMKYQYLQWSIFNNKVQDTKVLCERLLSTQPVTVELYNKMIEFETNQLKVEAKSVRHLYDLCLLNFGTFSVDTWMNYVKFELQSQYGKPSKVGNIYRKALKSLRPEFSNEFIERYSVLNA